MQANCNSQKINSKVNKIPSFLGEYILYEPKSGKLKWKKKSDKFSHYASGDDAGTYHNGYIRIKFRGRYYLGHRVAWFLYYGEQPRHIDHVNRIREDNRIENLRECTFYENQMNVGLRSDNTSGFKGVYFHKQSQRWRAKIVVRNKTIGLGQYADKSEAVQARLAAEKKYHSEFRCQ